MPEEGNKEEAKKAGRKYLKRDREIYMGAKEDKRS